MHHKGGYVSFAGDITKFLKAGKNSIAVEARDDVRNPLIPRGKQSERLHSHDCDYTRTTGIWQTVWVEFVPKSYIKSIKLFPNPEQRKKLYFQHRPLRKKYRNRCSLRGQTGRQIRLQKCGRLRQRRHEAH